MTTQTQSIGFLAMASLLLPAQVYALSPPNPLADIPWQTSTAIAGSVESVEEAFTQARRTEETQHNLAALSLGELDLPAQVEWDSMKPAEKALTIINAERTARHEVFYPNHGTVLGLAFTAAETHLNAIAQSYADYMVANNFWAHQVPKHISAPPLAGTDSFSRISEHAVIGDNCHQFLPYAENLYATATTVANAATPTLLIETAIYNWLYVDKGSAWGHRVAMLLQDQTLDGAPGFHNDRGAATDEGFIGIGFSGSGDGSYRVFNDDSFPSQWNVVWLVIDPVPGTSCQYKLTPTT